MRVSQAQKGGWTITWLLFFFQLINSVDKAVIGLVAVPMMKDLALTPKEFGLVVSSFYLLFSISAVVGGFIVNRVQARWVLLIMMVMWSLTQFPMLGTVGLTTLIACRIVLGAGEGPAFPIALHAAYKWFPNELRTVPSAIIAQGGSIGALVAIPVLGYVIEALSWRWAFGVLGVSGLVWAAVWTLLGKEGSLSTTTARDTHQQIGRVPYVKLLLNSTTLSCFVTCFGAYWGFSLLLGWFTPFLIQGLGFTQKEASWITMLPWITVSLVVLASGWLSQSLVTRGVTTRWARGVLTGGGVVVGALALIAVPFMPGSALKIAVMVVGMGAPSIVYATAPVILSEFTPVSQRGAVLAINNAVATTAGLIGPYLMGSLVQRSIETGVSVADSYMHGFTVCGIVALGCGLVGTVFLSPQREAARLAQAVQPQAIAAE